MCDLGPGGMGYGNSYRQTGQGRATAQCSAVQCSAGRAVGQQRWMFGVFGSVGLAEGAAMALKQSR